MQIKVHLRKENSHRFIITRIALAAILLFSSFCSLSAQEKCTLNGYVKDSLTGETLIAASINITGGAKGVATNAYGFFSITLAKGNYEVACSFVGYETKICSISLDSNRILDILLTPKSVGQNNVIVTARRRDANIKMPRWAKWTCPLIK